MTFCTSLFSKLLIVNLRNIILWFDWYLRTKNRTKLTVRYEQQRVRTTYYVLLYGSPLPLSPSTRRSLATCNYSRDENKRRSTRSNRWRCSQPPRQKRLDKWLAQLRRLPRHTRPFRRLHGASVRRCVDASMRRCVTTAGLVWVVCWAARAGSGPRVCNVNVSK